MSTVKVHSEDNTHTADVVTDQVEGGTTWVCDCGQRSEREFYSYEDAVMDAGVHVDLAPVV